MNQLVTEKDFAILLAPVLTEKSTALEVDRQYVFHVKNDSTKQEIKHAIQAIFSVDVESVHVCNTRGKIKKFGKITGKRKSWKKAYIKLKEGQAIK